MTFCVGFRDGIGKRGCDLLWRAKRVVASCDWFGVGVLVARLDGMRCYVRV
jgi:hypothetical protein